MSRLASKVDTSHDSIRAAFRKLGWSWLNLHTLGKGAPDGLVSKGSIGFLVECKTGKGKLNPDQEKFHAEWRGDIHVVRTPEEAVKVHMLYMGNA